MSSTLDQRERLAEIRRRSAEARSKMVEAREVIRQAAGDQQVRRAGEVALERARGDASIADELERTILSGMAGISSARFSDSFLDDPSVVEELQSLATSKTPIGNMRLGPAMSAESLAQTIQSGNWGGSGRLAASTVDLPDPARQQAPWGIRPEVRRPLRILDLIATSTMSGESFTYVQEASPGDAPSGSDPFSSASPVVEGDTKPQSSVVLTDATVRAVTIAHYYKLLRQQMSDVPGLATIVESRLNYGVLRQVENQILAGDGTGENMLGILKSSIGSVVYDGSQLVADQVLEAVVDVLVSNATPNAVVVNPLDWAAMRKARATDGGDGHYFSGGPFIQTASQLWDIAVITSNAIPVGQVLVGDFSQVTLFIREAVNVRLSDADQDDFIRNRVTMLGEGRFGCALWMPAAFALVHLTA